MIFTYMAQEIIFAVESLGAVVRFAREGRHVRLEVLELMPSQILGVSTAGVIAAFSLTLVAVGLVGM